MKILLVAINAKYIHSNLAVYSLRAYARKYLGTECRAEIEIAEYTTNQQIDDILAGIYKARADVVCFSCYIWNIHYTGELIREYHKLCKDVPIWVGGPEVSYETGKFLKQYPEVSGAMRGEGEETFLELCRYYADCGNAARHGMGQDAGFAGIAGLFYRDGETLCDTGEREPVDMSGIPFCYENIADFKNRIIYYESSRGCPFHCSYCLSSVEKKLRFRNTELVKKELAFFIEQEAPQVKFVDRTFNCSHEHAMEIWWFIRERDKGITNFHFEISADLLTEEELELLNGLRPGLVQLEIGVQSTNPKTISEIHRSMELPRLKEVVRQIQKGNNIHEHLDLIAGLPHEDYDTFVKSFDEIYALKPNQLQLGFLKVLKGSYLYEHAREYGIVYHENPPYEVLKTDWLGYDELLCIKQAEEMLEVYYNSGQYEITMKLLETQFSGAFFLYQSLGRFYEEKGYDKMSHSRIRRAEILLEFTAEQAKAAVPVLRESLVFDLYYRENMKSRPQFAPDPTEWREITRKYCRDGKQTHVERFSYRFSDRRERTARRLPLRELEPVYILFDYRERDPLTNQALCYEIKPQKEDE